MKKFIYRIWQREDGLAALEASFCLPLLIALYISGVTFFDATRAKQTLSYAAMSTVDLVTRQESITNDGRDRIFGVAEALAGKYADEDTFQIILGSVFLPADYAEEAGEDDDQAAQKSALEIGWSLSNRQGKELDDEMLEKLSIPKLVAGDSVIVAIVSAQYSPSLLASNVIELDIEQIAVRRPRFATQIPYENN